LFNTAEAYLAAAEILRDGPDRPLSEMPIRFLLYHAAELYLKAHLRASGMTLAVVVAKGHRFTKLLAATTERGLTVPAEAAAVLEFGQNTDDVMGSRYIRTGFGRWVELAGLHAAVVAIRRAVVEHADRPKHIILWGEGYLRDRVLE
jgi:hypothetical protein